MAYKLKILIPVLYAFVGISVSVYFIYQHTATLWQYVGLVITVMSFLLWIMARIQLADNFSIGAKANRLISTGLYSKLSHPVYLFSITTIIGIALVLQSLIILGLCGILAVLEFIRIRAEEKVLMKKFGKQYSDYKKTVWL